MAGRRTLHVPIGYDTGEATVVQELDNTQPRTLLLRCRCGADFTAPVRKVASGHTRSCGCARRRRVIAMNTSSHHPGTTHGASSHPHYDRWCGMMARCYNPEAKGFAYWGGRGIRVCDAWHDPLTFMQYLDEVLGPRPDGWSMDRINNDGDYEPGNIRWADHSTQQKNRRPFPIGVPMNERHDMRIH